MISEETSKVASQCRHYAMCKIDFLQTGLCPAGEENHFVSYYPQGRMDLVHALAFAGELGKRRIGLAVAVPGAEYMSTFMAPTRALGDRIKSAFREDLGIEYTVLVLGDPICGIRGSSAVRKPMPYWEKKGSAVPVSTMMSSRDA